MMFRGGDLSPLVKAICMLCSKADIMSKPLAKTNTGKVKRSCQDPWHKLHK